jgi:XRE family transcriptional regulator, fatty acid utilization regulator
MAELSEEQVATGRWLRHFRRLRGLTLQQVAERSGCTVSHLSQIETGKREPRMALLRALAATLGVTIADLTGDAPPSARDALEMALNHAQTSPTYLATGLPVVRPSRALSDDVLTALVGLHAEIHRSTATAAATPEEARRANTALRQEMRDRGNYFGEIEQAATDLLAAIKHQGGPFGERRTDQVAAHLGFTIHRVPDVPHSTRAITDLRHRRIYIPLTGWGGHDPRTIVLQTLGHQVLGHRPPLDYADFLRQRVEVNYFAAAMLISEVHAVELLKRGKSGRYLAVEDLRDAFGVSYETAAHRFTNLASHHIDIPVHFVKVHESGTIYKAYENDGYPLPTDSLGSIEGQLACRKSIERLIFDPAYAGPSESQYIDTPAGTFWTTAQSETTSAGPFSVGIGTTFDAAKWFRGRDTTRRTKSTCPAAECCRRPPLDLEARWAGHAWPSARAHAHLLAALPPGTFPGVDETEVFAFLEQQSMQH